jgi:hypothetical protein
LWIALKVAILSSFVHSHKFEVKSGAGARPFAFRLVTLPQLWLPVPPICAFFPQTWDCTEAVILVFANDHPNQRPLVKGTLVVFVRHRQQNGTTAMIVAAGFRMSMNSAVLAEYPLPIPSDRNCIRERALALLRTAVGSPTANFRPDQWEAIDRILKRERLLVVERTGWGKSSVYFLATRLLRDKVERVDLTSKNVAETGGSRKIEFEDSKGRHAYARSVSLFTGLQD